MPFHSCKHGQPKGGMTMERIADKQPTGSTAPQPGGPASQPPPSVRPKLPLGPTAPGRGSAALSRPANKHALQQPPPAGRPISLPQPPKAINLADDTASESGSSAVRPRQPTAAGLAALPDTNTAKAPAHASRSEPQPGDQCSVPAVRPAAAAEAGTEQPPASSAQAGSGAVALSTRKRPRRPASSASTAQVLGTGHGL